MPKCSFCSGVIEKGTGKIFVYSSGKQSYFCGMKCEKNLLKLKRKPLQTRWTESYRKEHKKDEKVEAPKSEEKKAQVEKKSEPTKEQAPAEEKQAAEPKAPAKEEKKEEPSPNVEDKNQAPKESQEKKEASTKEPPKEDKEPNKSKGDQQ